MKIIKVLNKENQDKQLSYDKAKKGVITQIMSWCVCAGGREECLGINLLTRSHLLFSQEKTAQIATKPLDKPT